MRKTTTRMTIGAAVLALAATAVVAAPAQAREVERETSGSCSGGAFWQLNLEREFGVIDIDFDIEGATPGERWTVRFTKNGNAAGTRTVIAERDGDVDSSRVVRAARGTNTIGATATSAGGQTCSATLRI